MKTAVKGQSKDKECKALYEAPTIESEAVFGHFANCDLQTGTCDLAGGSPITESV